MSMGGYLRFHLRNWCFRRHHARPSSLTHTRTFWPPSPLSNSCHSFIFDVVPAGPATCSLAAPATDSRPNWGAGGGYPRT